MWNLDPEITFLNHGSFGACPQAVMDHQQRLRVQLERNPVQFMSETYPEALDSSRRSLAEFVGTDPEGLVFVPNATTGVNAVLRSLEPTLRPGDEILITNHGYNACNNAAEFVTQRAGATLVRAEVPFPIEGPQQVLENVLNRITPRTKLLLIDHVTSPTGLVLPIEDLIAQLEPTVPVLIDGAHAPGMVDLDLTALGASFYTGNCHKWMCAPKGAGFLHVAPSYRDQIQPVTISHGWSHSLGQSRIQAMFDWTGTDDPTARLSVGAAIEAMGAAVPGGWAEVRRSNRDLAIKARDILCETAGIQPPAPDSMIGSLAAIPIRSGGPQDPAQPDPLQHRLRHDWHIEVPVFAWPAPPLRQVRISAQIYNDTTQYQMLAEALVKEHVIG